VLSPADNELLTRIGPGTPMGALLRQYWIPVLFPEELSSDGAPQRVRLLGEDLIAFRDSDGRPGLIQNNCPHRGASLFFGRNEESGLRCVYHGWKFDVTGACVDMPNEPAESDFKMRVRARAYPSQEWGGVVWAYMGERSAPPPLPLLEWATLPAEQRRFPWRAIRQCNWAQALEGDMDTSHAYFLHGRLSVEDPGRFGNYHADRAPRLFVVDTDCGVMYGSRRVETPSSYYWRTSQFLMPFITMFPADPDGLVPGHMWVPMDDENTLIWCFAWAPARPLTDRERAGYSSSGQPSEIWKPNDGPNGFRNDVSYRPYKNNWPIAEMDNDFQIDRTIQHTQTFTGIPTVPLQDDAMTTSMGRIQDRTIEHLGSADAMIIRVRRRLIDAARALEHNGTAPPGVDAPENYRKRSAAKILANEVDWITALRDWHAAASTEVL
jgi:phthalate 4,5-dioxygenase oxygenase subunit